MEEKRLANPFDMSNILGIPFCETAPGAQGSFTPLTAKKILEQRKNCRGVHLGLQIVPTVRERKKKKRL